MSRHSRRSRPSRPLRRIRRAATAAALTAATLGLSAPVAGADRSRAEHEEEIRAWRAARHAGLLKPDGWLTLVGLAWLEAGENPFGSAAGNRVRLPAGTAPPRAGTFVVRDGAVSVRVAKGVAVTSEGKPVRAMPLATDADGAPTKLALGTLELHVIERGGRLAVRIKDSESPARARFAGIEYYDVDPALRVVARLEPYDPPKTLVIPNVMEYETEEVCPAALVFELDGEAHRLDPVDAGDEYFVIFGDATNGRETYGGGRFLYARKPGPDGAVVLDFNKAYNPPCVFSPYATCPLPPAQNKLAVPIQAGEKDYRGPAAH